MPSAAPPRNINRIICCPPAVAQAFYALVLTVLTAQLAFGNSPTLIDGTASAISIIENVDYIHDPEGAISINELAGGNPADKQWTPVTSQSINFGIDSTTYWYRFQLQKTPAASDKSWLMEISWPLLSSVDIYRITPNMESGAETVLESGFLRPPENNYLAHRTPLVPIRLEADEPTTFIVRVRTAAFHLVPIWIHQKEPYLEESRSQLVSHGVGFGILIVIFLYNLLLGVSSREDTFVKYSIYVGLIFIWLTDALGYRSQFFWVPWLNPSFYVMSALLFFPPCISFFRSLLDLRTTWPLADRIFLTAQWLSVPLIIYNYVAPYNSILIAQTYCTLTFNAAFIIALKRALEKDRTAAWFLVAWTALAGAVAVFQSTCLGFTSLGAEVIDWVLYAVALETILLSLIVGQRYNWLKRDKAQAVNLAMEKLQEANREKQERIKAQEDVLTIQKDLNANLEKKVADRTRELERLVKDKSTFLSHLSHELRSPLNGVIGILELLDERTTDQQLRKHIEQARNTGDYLTSLINNFLDFSKIEEEQFILEQINFDLRELVDESLSMLALKAEQKGIELISAIDDDVPNTITGDPTRLKQVLINLSNNALKFTEEGNITIESAVIDGRIKLCVRDTGIGIPQDKLDTIFNAYSQASTDTSRKFGGTGLGLDISQKIVNLMGSRIEVDSREGEGSCFFFWLTPEPGTAQQHQQAAKDNGQRQQPRALEDKAVLIVEDNPVNAMVINRQINRLGIKVMVAENGREALDCLEREAFDLVLMDVNMPEMDGIEATIQIRRKEIPNRKGGPLTIIALSGISEDEELENCYSAGMNGHLAKPFSESQLVVVLNRYLGD